MYDVFEVTKQLKSHKLKLVPLASIVLICLAARAQFASAASFDAITGESLYRVGQYQKAMESFLQAAKDSPSDPYLHYQLGLCYQHLNQRVLAQGQFALAMGLAAGDAALRAKASAAMDSVSDRQPAVWTTKPATLPAVSTTSTAATTDPPVAADPVESLFNQPAFFEPKRTPAMTSAMPPKRLPGPQTQIASKPAPPIVISGRPRIIEFYTDW